MLDNPRGRSAIPALAPREVRAPARTLLAMASVLSSGMLSSWRWPRCRPAEMLSSWCSTIPGRLISVAGPAPWEVRAPARTLLAVASVLSGGNAVELVLDNPRGAISDPGTCPLGGSSTSSYLAGGGLGVVRGNAVELVLDNPREVDQRRRSSLLGGSSTSSYLAGGGISVVRRKTLSSWCSTIPGGRPGLTSQGVARVEQAAAKPPWYLRSTRLPAVRAAPA